MTEWLPIATAPKDGTVIRVRNPQMERPVLAKWGEYIASWGTKYPDNFVLVRDDDRFMPLPKGTLVCPTEWQPVTLQYDKERRTITVLSQEQP